VLVDCIVESSRGLGERFIEILGLNILHQQAFQVLGFVEHIPFSEVSTQGTGYTLFLEGVKNTFLSRNCRLRELDTGRADKGLHRE